MSGDKKEAILTDLYNYLKAQHCPNNTLRELKENWELISKRHDAHTLKTLIDQFKADPAAYYAQSENLTPRSRKNQ